MPFRLITKSIHAYLIDYPVAIVLMVAPFLLKLGQSSPVALWLSDDVAPGAMLAELMEDNKALAASMRQAHKLCDELDDVATASLLEGYIDAAEKRAWFLREAAQPH